jgi:hypothetical protein
LKEEDEAGLSFSERKTATNIPALKGNKNSLMSAGNKVKAFS